MLNEVQQVINSADLLYNTDQVEAAIDKMADNITLLLAERAPLLLCVMNGGIVLGGKLITRLNFPLTLDSINASRYRNRTYGSEIEWIHKPTTILENRTVLIVDDVLDEGFTLRAIYDYCQAQGASSIYTAVLVNKNLGDVKPIEADFIGLEAENRYLFGYGMDYKGYCRNAAGIYACKEESE
jgi:hypoxanthine phosphoribosyltransferase